MVEVDTFLVYRALHADGHSINHREFREKLALALIHNNFGVSISPVAAQSIGNKAVADSPHSTHHFMPLTTLEQYQSKQGCAGGARRKCLVCVPCFQGREQRALLLCDMQLANRWLYCYCLWYAVRKGIPMYGLASGTWSSTL